MESLSIRQIKESESFKLVRELKFNDILSFVLENIRKRNAVTISFYTILILFLSLFIGGIISFFSINGVSIATFKVLGKCFFLGFVSGSLLIIPLHEGLHALGFLLAGARKIKFGADLKQFIVYATAENFVAGRKSFFVIALAPIVVINLVCLPFLIFGGFEIKFFIITMLLLHNTMCIGDFGMLSFFVQNKEKEMYTFDDVGGRVSWFYEKT